MIDDPEMPDVGIFVVGDSARWRVWASRAKEVELVLDPLGRSTRIPMRALPHGFFEVSTPAPQHGDRYGYALDGGAWLPDPASRWQPEGVNAPSAHDASTDFPWSETAWRGMTRAELVVYELHVGTFTHEGTFEAIIPRLDQLVELGITAIELMPVAQFSGVRSWGYDGVHPFAPQHSYGGPEGLRRLVNACHGKGLGVILDLVYNHFGPEGNVLSQYGDYLTDAYRTAWGAALNFDGRGCDAVRALICQNLRMWIRDYHIDGFRLDAADQIYDRSPRHILADLAELAHAEAARLGRPILLFAETDMNDAPRFLRSVDHGGYGLDGHWNDDFHHAVHSTLTQETSGYYVDFKDGPAALAKALEHVFVNNGNFSVFRGRRHGTSVGELGWERFIGFVQNHDQVGNRSLSDRYASNLSPAACRLAAGLLLLAPRLPLLFMGEEYGETAPFPYFCDYSSPDLVEAVRQGRAAEFAHFGWDRDPPDPFSADTQASAVLSWDWTRDEPRRRRALYRHLIELRRELAALHDPGPPRVQLHRDAASGCLLELTRGLNLERDRRLTILFNLENRKAPWPGLATHDSLWVRSEAPEWSGRSPDPTAIEPHEFLVVKGAGAID